MINAFKTDFISAVRDVFNKHAPGMPENLLNIALDEMFSACLKVIVLIEKTKGIR